MPQKQAFVVSLPRARKAFFERFFIFVFFNRFIIAQNVYKIEIRVARGFSRLTLRASYVIIVPKE